MIYEQLTGVYSEPALQQQFMPARAASEIKQPIVRKSQFDIALLILVKHLQQHIFPELFIDLSSHKFTSELLGFQ